MRCLSLWHYNDVTWTCLKTPPIQWQLNCSFNSLFNWQEISHQSSCAPSQYPKRRLSVRSRKVSKPRDVYLELSDCSEFWQALRQQCCRCACQISKRYDNLKYQSRGFETLRDLTKRRLFGYWDGALVLCRGNLPETNGFPTQRTSNMKSVSTSCTIIIYPCSPVPDGRRKWLYYVNYIQ